VPQSYIEPIKAQDVVKIQASDDLPGMRRVNGRCREDYKVATSDLAPRVQKDAMRIRVMRILKRESFYVASPAETTVSE
jgi:hypothetical protein